MGINRRSLFAAGLAGAALGAIGIAGRASLAQGVANAGYYRFKVGEIEATAINDGFFRRPLDGFIRNAAIEDVRAAMAASFLATDQITVPFTTLALRTGGKLVLIDSGNGNVGAPTSGTWMANFRAAGFDPAAVDIVVISHFHGDHINGLRLRDGSAVFPNAEVRVGEAEWGFWMDDARMAAAPDGMKPAFANVRRVFAPIAKDVARFGWDKEVAPGVTSVQAVGHTPGHSAFAVTSGSGRLLVMSDTTNHPALFVRNPDWSAIFDMDGDTARATRRRMLDLAATERMQVSFYHAPFPATGFIARDGNRFNLVPAAWAPHA